MDEKIIQFAMIHPVWITIIIPIILGIITSFISETIKVLFVNKAEKNPSALRYITFMLSLILSILVLILLKDVIVTIVLKILFILLNTFVAFMFYHLKGKQLVKIITAKLFKKVEQTSITGVGEKPDPMKEE